MIEAIKQHLEALDISPPGLGDGSKMHARINELESKINSMSDGSHGVSQTLARDEPIKGLDVFTGSGNDKVSFEKFKSVIVDQVDLRTSWNGVLKWARDHQERTILMSSLDPAQFKLSRELWSVLGYKLGGEAWNFRHSTEDGNGLDLWRAINYEYDRKTPGRATAIKKALLNLDPMKGPEDARKILETIEHGTRVHNTMAVTMIRSEEMHSFLFRTVPHEFVKLMLMQNNSIGTYQELKERLLGWSQGDRDWKLIQGQTNAQSSNMDIGLIGEIAQDPLHKADPWARGPAGSGEAKAPSLQELLKKVEEVQSQLAAVGVGKGGAAPDGTLLCHNCRGKGHFARDCPHPRRDDGKGGKSGTNAAPRGGKGEGRGDPKGDGKGKGRTYRRPGWSLCNYFRRTGACTRMGCPYAHANVPPRLQGIEGLVLSDLGNVSYDPATNTYSPADMNGLDIDAIVTTVHAEMAALHSHDDEAQGFQGQPVA